MFAFSKVGIWKFITFVGKSNFATAVVIPNSCKQPCDIRVTNMLWGSAPCERFDLFPRRAKKILGITPTFKPVTRDNDRIVFARHSNGFPLLVLDPDPEPYPNRYRVFPHG